MVYLLLIAMWDTTHLQGSEKGDVHDLLSTRRLQLFFSWASQVRSYLVPSFLTDIRTTRLCLSIMRVAFNGVPRLFIGGEPINQSAYAIGFT